MMILYSNMGEFFVFSLFDVDISREQINNLIIYTIDKNDTIEFSQKFPSAF